MNAGVRNVMENINMALVGKERAVGLVMTCLLAKGHALLEDVPGIGKTTLVSALAASVSCTFARIQFTPDLMPSDITGFSMADFNTGEFTFRPGAIMRQIVLADEINRSSPKTQSALLEVMQENQVTVDGKTYQVPSPFMVLATQNPVEYTGTYVLPEAQLDRFLMKITLGYPDQREEIDILERHDGLESAVLALKPVLRDTDLLALQKGASEVSCGQAIKRYIAQLAEKTRNSAATTLGISPRASIALMRASKALAFIHGRSYVLPDDVQFLAVPVLAHRLILKPEARMAGVTAEGEIARILRELPLPDREA